MRSEFAHDSNNKKMKVVHYSGMEKNKKLPSGMNLQADLCVSWLDSHFQVHIVPQGRQENGPLLAGND
jgi:hypothetical protein